MSRTTSESLESHLHYRCHHCYHSSCKHTRSDFRKPLSAHVCSQWLQAAKPAEWMSKWIPENLALNSMSLQGCDLPKTFWFLQSSWNSFSHLMQFKLWSITTLAMCWRSRACSINDKPCTSKSLKGMKRKRGPGHLSSCSCSCVGWAVHAPGCSYGFHPIRSLWLNICQCQPK